VVLVLLKLQVLVVLVLLLLWETVPPHPLGRMHRRARRKRRHVESGRVGCRDEDDGAWYKWSVEAELEDDWGTMETVVETGCHGS
jgi:hypothetical protein